MHGDVAKQKHRKKNETQPQCGRNGPRGHTTHPHQPLRDAQPSMRAHHAQTRDMPMRHPVRRLLLHLGQHVPDHLGVLLPGARAGAGTQLLVVAVAVLGPHDGHEAQLRPGEGMVEVVLEEVVLGEVGDVAGLDGGEEVDVGGVGREREDVDHCGMRAPAVRTDGNGLT